MKRLPALLICGLGMWIPGQAKVWNPVLFTSGPAYTINNAASIYNGDFIYSLTLTQYWAPAHGGPGGTVTPAAIEAGLNVPAEAFYDGTASATHGTYTSPGDQTVMFTGFTPASGPIYTVYPVHSMVFIISEVANLTITSNNITRHWGKNLGDFQTVTGLIPPGMVPESSALMSLGAWVLCGLLFLASSFLHRRHGAKGAVSAS